jgi:hypothetical protein
MTETTWDYVIQDYSPLFVYSSTRGTGNNQVANLDIAWNQDCPILPSGPLNNYLCDVASAHTTNVSGAAVTLTFYGVFSEQSPGCCL